MSNQNRISEQLTKALQEKADQMIDPIRMEISIRFKDPELARIMGLVRPRKDRSRSSNYGHALGLSLPVVPVF